MFGHSSPGEGRHDNCVENEGDGDTHQTDIVLVVVADDIWHNLEAINRVILRGILIAERSEAARGLQQETRQLGPDKEQAHTCCRRSPIDKSFADVAIAGQVFPERLHLHVDAPNQKVEPREDDRQQNVEPERHVEGLRGGEASDVFCTLEVQEPVHGQLDAHEVVHESFEEAVG